MSSLVSGGRRGFYMPGAADSELNSDSPIRTRSGAGAQGGHIIIKKLRLIIIKLRLTVIKLVKLDNNNFITGVIDTRTPHFTVIEYGRRPRGRVRHVPGHGWGI